MGLTLNIDLAKLFYNASYLHSLLHARNIDLIGVTKGFAADPKIADVLLKAGIRELADSRIENIKKMKAAKINAKFHLSRPPLPSQTKMVVDCVDISFNSELQVIKLLSKYAQSLGKTHRIILLIELGDLRDGMMPDELDDIVSEVLKLPSIQIVGIATNLGCFNGAKPDELRMTKLIELADQLKCNYDLDLEYISGGNSANYKWFIEHTNPQSGINNLRLGEAILLGHDPQEMSPIKNLFHDVFSVRAEVIEVKRKPVSGVLMTRAIFGLGYQDLPFESLIPHASIKLLGMSSDHMVAEVGDQSLSVGDIIPFGLTYPGLLAAMTSEYIDKRYLNEGFD